MNRLCSVVALIGGLLGGLILFAAMPSAETAIQDVSIATFAIGLAVIPYFITRSIQLLISGGDAHALQQIQSSLVEIRSGLMDYQTDVSPAGSHRALTTESTPRETIARPEAGVTRQENGVNLKAKGRIFEETKYCPSCSESN